MVRFSSGDAVHVGEAPGLTGAGMTTQRHDLQAAQVGILGDSRQVRRIREAQIEIRIAVPCMELYGQGHVGAAACWPATASIQIPASVRARHTPAGEAVQCAFGGLRMPGNVLHLPLRTPLKDRESPLPRSAPEHGIVTRTREGHGRPARRAALRRKGRAPPSPAFPEQDPGARDRAWTQSGERQGMG